MDHSERYDPEDIEHLMAERSFAELLPEERAYVLRHLSGPEEYEAMRALMLHLKEGPEEGEPMDADPMVRERVMSAFRDAQQPRWRIWLNSVGTWFIPEDGFAVWRPALVLGTLALLVVSTVVVVQRMNSSENALAEVKPAKQLGNEEGRAPMQQTDTDPAVTAAPTDHEEKGPGSAVATRNLQEDVTPMPQQAYAEEAKPDVPATTAHAVMDERMATAQEAPEDAVAFSDAEVARKEQQSSGHVVTLEELSTNMSVANATGKVRAAAPPAPMRERDAGLSRSVAQQPELLQLVAAGW